MLFILRQELARELAKIAIAIEHDHVEGVFIVAVHANGTSSEILVPPLAKQHIEKLMLAVDRLHFRSKVACYLGAKKPGGESGPSAGTAPESETEQ